MSLVSSDIKSIIDRRHVPFKKKTQIFLLLHAEENKYKNLFCYVKCIKWNESERRHNYFVFCRDRKTETHKLGIPAKCLNTKIVIILVSLGLSCSLLHSPKIMKRVHILRRTMSTLKMKTICGSALDYDNE